MDFIPSGHLPLSMAIDLLARRMFDGDCTGIGSVTGDFERYPEWADSEDYRKMRYAVMAFRRLAWDGKIRTSFVDEDKGIPARRWGGDLGERLASVTSGAGLVWAPDRLTDVIVPRDDVRRIFKSYSSRDLRRLGDVVRDVLLSSDKDVLTPTLDTREQQPATEFAPPAEEVSICRTGGAGRPSSMHLVKSELERRMAKGKVWKSKSQAAEELASWLPRAYPKAPPLTPKAILNSLRRKIPTARNCARN